MTTTQDKNPTQTPEERLREKMVQARYSKYETYEKLDPMEQEIIDTIMQAVKAEIGAARLAEAEEILKVAFEGLGPEVYFAKQRLEGHVEILRNHFGIGEASDAHQA